ncbi:MarR family transcriptional regulator [Kineococcus sp. NPDC059986]|jgi:DNA-binding MarR family transcriptional regulator|uniref:MarR family winged helix-turn-helix transcriptional regulator n=1 Tax=Kineococcus sp. NPDC059986 TaxID=3155538 RepID=UPI00344C6AB2
MTPSTTLEEPAGSSTGPLEEPPVGAPQDDLVAAVADQVSRQMRALHSFKAQIARGENDVERAMHVVLYVLADTGPLRVSALAERLGTDPSTTSRQTGELVRRELLRKLPDPDDRRASLLDVTETGHQVVAQMKQRRHEHLARAVDDFAADELVAFTTLLSRFADGLERARTDCLRTTTPAPGENA